MSYKGEYEEISHDVGIPTIADCLRKHDPARSRFSTYCWRALQRKITRHLQRVDYVQLSIDLPAKSDIEKLDARDTVQWVLGRLNEYDRLLLTLKFMNGSTYEEIGDAIHSNKSVAHKHFARALARAKRLID